MRGEFLFSQLTSGNILWQKKNGPTHLPFFSSKKDMCVALRQMRKLGSQMSHFPKVLFKLKNAKCLGAFALLNDTRFRGASKMCFQPYLARVNHQTQMDGVGTRTMNITSAAQKLPTNNYNDSNFQLQCGIFFLNWWVEKNVHEITTKML